jgi:hypothetical protein
MNREDDARRDLERVAREREKLLFDQPSRSDDDDDPTVRLGKRIARILAPLLALGLVIYLSATYLT